MSCSETICITFTMATIITPLKIITGVAIFLFVFVFIMAIFGQRGRAEITPEREIALASGAADRKTVFEMPVIQPVVWLMLVTARQLPIPVLKVKLRRTLVAAGSPNFYTPDEFIAVAMLWGLVIGIILEVISIKFIGGASIILPVSGFLIGIAGVVYHLYSKASNRIRQIGRRMPYTLDLIALAMGAGATFTEAVRTVVGEDPEHPFSVELNTVLAEIDLGTTRRRALMNMTDRIPQESLRSIVAAIIQAETLGTPLSDILKQQADLLRLQRSVRAEKLAASASVRILIPSLLILLSVVLTVFATIIIKGVRGELMF
ncbi:MAG: type II secretion system F family protein [Planctomycetota bacterium]|nr:type II secretion system F family protein [Planctomycetota bacterium]